MLASQNINNYRAMHSSKAWENIITVYMWNKFTQHKCKLYLVQAMSLTNAQSIHSKKIIITVYMWNNILRDAPFDIWNKIEKNSLSPQKSEKKVWWKCGQKKKVCCRNWWKICWPEKTPNGNVHNRESIRQRISSTKHKKKIRTLIAKKSLFSTGGKKKVCKQQKL